MPSTTVIVLVGGLFWLKLVANAMFMLCNTVSVEWFLLEPCHVVMCEMLFVTYGCMFFF